MQAHELRCKIASIGAWGSYFDNWESLKELLANNSVPTEKLKGPKPAVIPANERRRAPLPVRLAVDSSWQATQAIEISPSLLNCVFVSGLGDTDLTDYMCKVLASEHKELSPTKFHNSVHNAPAGYWTISTESMGAANSIAGFEQSVPLTLMEAMIQCHEENQAILVTLYDAPVSAVLSPLLSNQEPFSLSLVLLPDNDSKSGYYKAENSLNLSLSATVQSSDASKWPELQTYNEFIRTLYNTNPAGRILALAETIANRTDLSNPVVTLPLSEGTSITFHIG